jgi:hypothetical protein
MGSYGETNLLEIARKILGWIAFFSPGSFRHRIRSPYLINVAHVQLVMKRHQYGAPHGIPLDAFLHSEVEKLPNNNYKELLSTECRIASGELLLRSQHWVLIPTDRRYEIVYQDVFKFLCEHIGEPRRPKCRDRRLQKMLRCSLAHAHRLVTKRIVLA